MDYGSIMVENQCCGHYTQEGKSSIIKTRVQLSCVEKGKERSLSRRGVVSKEQQKSSRNRQPPEKESVHSRKSRRKMYKRLENRAPATNSHTKVHLRRMSREHLPKKRRNVVGRQTIARRFGRWIRPPPSAPSGNRPTVDGTQPLE